MPGPFDEIARTDEFQVALVIGAALAVGAFYTLADRRPRLVVPVGGLLIAGGFALGLAASSGLPANLVVGVGLLAVAGYVAHRGSVHWLAAPALALPGALVLIVDLGPSPPAWVAPVTVAAVVVACPLVADFERRFSPAGWPMALYAVSVVGVYFTVPDTERAVVLLGVAIPLVFVAWPIVLAPLGPSGSYAAIGVLLWVAATESRGRGASLIGAVGCLGLLVAEPLARALGRGRYTLLGALPRRTWSFVTVGALQLGLVYIASRVAGLRTSVAEAVLIVGFELALATAVLYRGYVRASP
jgi:hypothetical protein